MIDTYGRKYVNSIIDKTANMLLNLKMTANHVTVAAFFIGACTGPLIYFNQSFAAIIFLWFSGFLDAVDGAMARMSKTTSPWGTLMDICFDRLVEMTVVLALALRFSNVRFELLVLVICVLMSMTIFLTVGALVKQKGMKSFYYQAGLAERTEGFIFFSLMIIFPVYLSWVINGFSAAIMITIIQRIVEAKGILDN